MPIILSKSRLKKFLHYSPILDDKLFDRQDNKKYRKEQNKTNQALTKFNETVWSDSSICLHHVISSNELLLKLIQEREGQNIWVIFSAQHHVAHSQRANKTTV